MPKQPVKWHLLQGVSGRRKGKGKQSFFAKKDQKTFVPTLARRSAFGGDKDGCIDSKWIKVFGAFL